MGRRGQSITLSISNKDKEQLEQIALEQGMRWGEKPNISRLVEAIARRELLIGRNHDWAQERLQGLVQAIQALTDAGQPEIARTIAELLLERSELPNPLRRQLEQSLGMPLIPWRQLLEDYIRRQQPFELAYRDATDRLWRFTIRHARIAIHEKRQYLDCWCEETEANQDIAALSHNWTLRLDRIGEAAVSSISGPWLPSLDQVPVEFDLFAGLAFAYQAKPEDQRNEWLSDRSQVRRVQRLVSSTFWFFREILPYGEECEIVGPASIRDRFKEKVRSLYQRYELYSNPD